MKIIDTLLYSYNIHRPVRLTLILKGFHFRNFIIWALQSIYVYINVHLRHRSVHFVWCTIKKIVYRTEDT